ncbi:MAG: hypothetical protein SGI97_02695 [candidate division Zixibacteria bacterium]|nr:hypothetical protein [candidate division Zixibacteria bacterium]
MSILKKTVLASIGAFEITKAKAEKIIDELIAKGELDQSDRKKAMIELLERAGQSTSDFTAKVKEGAEKTATKLADELHWAKKSDLDRLEAKVDALIKTVSELAEKINRRPIS